MIDLDPDTAVKAFKSAGYFLGISILAMAVAAYMFGVAIFKFLRELLRGGP